MLTKRLSIAAAIVVLGIAAACSSNSGPSTVYPQPGGNVTGQTFTFTPVGGYSGTVTLSGPSGASPAPVTVSLSTSVPSGAGSLAAKKRAPQVAASPVPQVFITMTAGTGGATISRITALQVTLPAAVPAGESLYLAYWDGTQWLPLKPGTIFGAATLVSGTTYSFAGGSLATPITLAAGQSAYFVIYEGTIQVGPTPTPSPTPAPTASPVPNAIANGNFETGSLSPWYACSPTHQNIQNPVNPSPAPVGTQNPAAVYTPLPAEDLAPFASVSPPPPNYNPTHASDTPGNLGSWSGLAGSLQGTPGAAVGLCQAVTVPASGLLTFWVYEGGEGFAFYNSDQEAAIYDSGFTNILDTLFMEQNCFYDALHLNYTGEENSGCDVNGTSTFDDWSNGGFWTQRGPYDLSSLAGQNVIVFLGVWQQYYDVPPSKFDQYMFVDNVTLESGVPPTAAPTASPTPMATISATIQGGSHR